MIDGGWEVSLALVSDVDFDVSLGFVTNFGHKQLTRSAGRETGSTSDEENSRDIQILIWSHQNSCTCQKEDKPEDELFAS